MSNQRVYVVRHYGYEYWEFESLIGLAKTKAVADDMARNNEHVLSSPVIVYDQEAHMGMFKRSEPHVYIEIMEVKHD